MKGRTEVWKDGGIGGTRKYQGKRVKEMYVRGKEDKRVKEMERARVRV